MKKLSVFCILVVLAFATQAMAVSAVTLKNYSASGTKLIPAYCTYTKGVVATDGSVSEPVIVKFANMTTIRSSGTFSVSSVGDYTIKCFKTVDNAAASMLMYFDSDSTNYTSIQNFILRRR